MAKVDELKAAVEAGRGKIVPGMVEDLLNDGMDAIDILSVMIDAMGIVGENFKKGELFVPEMLIAANAMKKGVAVLKPHMKAEDIGAKGTIILGTVEGDLHDIGKNLVGMMYESAGFKVIDLGVDVPIQKFITTYEENPETKIIAASALLTTTMPSLKATVTAINEQPWRDKVKVMVGGAPITQEFSDEIGADVYTSDAASAAAKACELVG